MGGDDYVIPQYALFVYVPCEAVGGVDDIEMIGTIDQCIEAAEKSDHWRVTQIVALPSLKVVRRGKWRFQKNPLVGHEGAYIYEWKKYE